ncbi:iron-siderophore ABC transporter substrate-binding protein [Actinoplanes sp. N902-109]|uniref:ABC transporter substrate-binding protein n=1 Tax=Actinoplanes sp. (strain N902-109) TaxID=649831 RepID=UPI00032937A5|nr:iron-siderophore ABC transporter substrate-binding protein [Actinoplanes sp. N902-109]AGL17787.1 hypothetical protein L083_4277 [Actinoplanes sp. N902-109]
MLTNPLRRPLAAAATAVVAALALTACGTTEDADEAGSPSAAAVTGPVDLTDERGPVHLDAPAKAVVSLEWGLTESLVALGVKPVGVADVKNYNMYDTAAPVDAATPDVGTRGEPSVDAIVALKPDLIVTTTDLPATVVDQLAGQAPVIALRGSDSTDPLGYMRRTLTTLATATGTTPTAQKLLADFDAKLAAGKDALAKAGKTGAPFTMSDGWVDSGTVAVRMFTPGSFFGGIGEELGLTNQWTTGGDKDYGLAQTDVEGLTKITDPDTTFVYIDATAAGNGEFTTALTGNAVFKQTPFARSGKVKRISESLWTFGSVPSATGYVDALVTAFTS